MNSLFGVRSLCEAFQQTTAVDPLAIALRTAQGDVEITWVEYASRVRRLARGLADMGVRRGDPVALMMVNRPEFNLCDTAVLHLGGVPFSIYGTLPAEDIAYLFSNAGNRVVICEEQFVRRVVAAGAAIENIVCVDSHPVGTTSLAELEAQRADVNFDFESTWREVGPDDLLTIIYTSGTTGPPKGVELTHANMLAELAATSTILPVEFGDRVLSYLPSAHIADRFLSHYQSMAFGLQTTCVADPKSVAAALPTVRPTIWGAVPRIWEKMKAALESSFELDSDRERRKLVSWALDVGHRKVRAEQAAFAGDGSGPDDDLLAEYGRADELILRRIREQLGLDQVRWSVSGAAPTSIEVLEFFGALGIPVYELWGLSELAACGTINPPSRNRLGTVGPALPGVELRLAVDGELLCRSAQVMRGYRNEPEKTAEAVDADGWLHTGDVAQIDCDGYVRIIDRKKELIINSAGKNMSPANIEAKLKAASLLIGQAVAIGDRRPYNVALIVLDPDACAMFAKQQALPDASARALAGHPEIQAAIADAVRRANEQLARVEQIKSFTILPFDWEPSSDELTPTMKLKRRVITEKYASEIDALYGQASETCPVQLPT